MYWSVTPSQCHFEEYKLVSHWVNTGCYYYNYHYYYFKIQGIELKAVCRLLGHLISESCTQEEAAGGIGDDAPSWHLPGWRVPGGRDSAGTAPEAGMIPRNNPLAQGALLLRAGCRSPARGPHHPRGAGKAPALKIPACPQLQSDHR